jgi:HEAT repeat protein
VFQTLLSLLADESVRGSALEALWRYGDARALPAIERTPVREDDYEAKAKSTALRKLNRKRNENAA